MPIHNNRDTAINALVADFHELLRVGQEGNQVPPVAHPPTSAPRIGRHNTALVDLRRRRSTLDQSQQNIVNGIEGFYVNTPEPIKNRQLFSISDSEIATQSEDVQTTLDRRASFLLNNDVFAELPEALEAMGPEAGMLGHSNATLTVNAMLASVKSQIEHVNDAALQDAQRGDRICPMTLQPTKFNAFLADQHVVLDQLVRACHLPVRAGEEPIKVALEMLATEYFRHSTNYPGAPTLRPDIAMVRMDSDDRSKLVKNRLDHRIALLSIDSNGAKIFCQGSLPKLDDCEDFQTIYRARLLQGFDHHSPEKKYAALLVQLMLQEVSEVQEIMGVLSARIDTHSLAAKRAAFRTADELSYEGSDELADMTVATEEMPPQRALATHPMQDLPELDVIFQDEFHSPLITDPRIRSWVHSPEMIVDLRGLAEPSARLQSLSSPITGQALLQTPTFRTF